jgi:capsular polysaccharide biosynthesis protein
VVFNPPKVTSEAVIVVPGASASAMTTDVVIAQSDLVLSQALPKISPSLSLQHLRTSVTATSLTSSLIQVTGSSTTQSGAESIANAVADSFISYIRSPSSPIGHQEAELFESATVAKGASFPGRLVIFGLIGAVGGFLLGLVIALARNNASRTLMRRRGDIANSIAVPVLAAIRARRPTDAANWTRLFEDYDPGAVEAWQLHRLLAHVGATDAARSGNGSSRRSSLAVLSLSSDPGALALGPQIASYAASQGIRTALVVGPQQDDGVVATLRTACSGMSPIRTRPLLVSSERLYDPPAGTSLVVVVVVVDSGRPQMPDDVDTGGMVLGVSSGVVTADQLARAATAAAGNGQAVGGIVVANPDPTDDTTGLVPQYGRPAQHRLPTRLTGTPTEARR